ncbi:MAG: MarR family transcriptional regulator [Methanobrevibacter millerae]|uniref:MarR family transcriptional regulator n=1 Tax=Methanobrevibacter millerae TaxID=230361 RepID=A0A8T3VRD6_9EURY|nr:MarR family transcriptional regulator [Methanobrevibacter millerae]
MPELNFEDERISFTPIVLYAEFIHLQFHNYLKNNFKDISPVDFTYLVNIMYNQNVSQRQLAEILHVSESSVAQIIKKLEKNELVSRIPDENNKSRKILQLTEKSRLIVFSVIRDIYEGEAKILEEYSKEEIDGFKRMLYEYSEKS